MIEPWVFQCMMVAFVFVVIFLLIPFGSSCDHKWKIIGSTAKKFTPFMSTATHTSHVYVQECTKCGKINQVEIR